LLICNKITDHSYCNPALVVITAKYITQPVPPKDLLTECSGAYHTKGAEV